MVKSVVKPLIRRILRERIVPKKSVFTRAFGVFCFEIPWGRCLAPKASALPSALHPDMIYFCYIYKQARYRKLLATFPRIHPKKYIAFESPATSSASPPVESHSRLGFFGTLKNRYSLLGRLRITKTVINCFCSLTQSKHASEVTYHFSRIHPENA